MVRFAAALAVLAVLIVASLVWAADRPSTSQEPPAAERTKFEKGSVTTRAIRNNSIRLEDLAGPLRRLVRRPGPPGRDGEDGLDGLDGLDGEDGFDGEDGEDGVAGYGIVPATTVVPSGGGPQLVEADCPAGDVVLGGGVVPSGDSDDEFEVELSGLQADNRGWQARVRRTSGGGPWTVRVQAICADVSP
jgi:hypothetical protein